ncbi:MAG: C39 family peptidase [Parcubacteria group bacterium]
MKRILFVLVSVALLLVLSFGIEGCGEREIVRPYANSERLSATTDTTSAYSEHPFVYPGVMSAEEINELGRKEHQRRVAAGESIELNKSGWQLYAFVPFYSQRDGNWGSHALGYGNCGSSDNIYNYGCHLCCIAMLYAKWGYSSLTPPVLNDWSRNGRAHYAFYSTGCGDLIRVEEAMQYPAMCRSYRYISASQIYGELRAGHPVVVRTTVGGSHFMIIFAFDGQRYWVKDPWRDWTQQDQPLYGNAHQDGPFRVYGY